MFIVGVITIGIYLFAAALAYCPESLFTTASEFIHQIRYVVVIGEEAFILRSREQKRFLSDFIQFAEQHIRLQRRR